MPASSLALITRSMSSSSTICCEIEARRVYLSRGFSSLFDYVKRGLGYSDAATWRRINAMKLCTRIDGVRERLWDGSLTLDAAAQLQAAFQRRDRERGRGAGAGTGSAMGSNGSARPAPEPKPGPVLDVSAQKALVEQAAGKSTREVTKMLADVDPALAVPADRCDRWARGAGSSRRSSTRTATGAGAAQRAALARRSAHDDGAARGAAGQRRPRPPRSGPSPAPRTHPQRSRGCRPTSGSEAEGKLRRGRCVGDEAARPVRQHRRFGAAHRTGLERSSAVGSEAAGTAGRHPRFGAEVAPSGRSRHTGGGEARGLAARPRTLPLRRSTHRAPMRVTASAADRSRAPVRPGRRCAAGEPQIAVLRASPRPPYGADFTARAARVIVMDAPRNIVSRRSPRETWKIPPKSPNARRRHIKIVRAAAGLHRPSRTRHSTIRKGAIHEFLDRRW